MIYDLRFGLKLHLLSTKSQSQTHPKCAKVTHQTTKICQKYHFFFFIKSLAHPSPNIQDFKLINNNKK
jgi:hypothetical protein